MPIAVTPPSQLALAVTLEARPSAIVVVQGPQGPPGKMFSGFGQVRYANMAITGAASSFAAGVRQQLIFSPDPTQTQDFLKAPFVGHAFWASNRVVPRSGGYGDYLDVLVNLLVVSQIADGKLYLDIDVGSPLGPTGSATAALFNAAGMPERVTFRLAIQTLNYMLANGAALYLTSTVPVTVTSEALIIAPLSIGPGQ